MYLKNSCLCLSRISGGSSSVRIETVVETLQHRSELSYRKTKSLSSIANFTIIFSSHNFKQLSTAKDQA